MGDTLPPLQEGAFFGRSVRSWTSGSGPGLLNRSEMSLRERSARTGFQILLKATCRLFGGEFHRNNQRPRTVRHGVAGWPVVVPIKTITHVICDPGVMAGRIPLTVEDVHDPLFDSVHASRRRTDQAGTELVGFPQIAS